MGEGRNEAYDSAFDLNFVGKAELATELAALQVLNCVSMEQLFTFTFHSSYTLLLAD